MDFLRTLKKRKPKRHVPARVNVAPPSGDRPKSRGIRISRRGATLNLPFCFALLLTLAVITPGRADDYYVYRTSKGELVISNKEPPPGSTIIKQLPGEADREIPQAGRTSKPQPNEQPEGSPKPSNNK